MKDLRAILEARGNALALIYRESENGDHVSEEQKQMCGVDYSRGFRASLDLLWPVVEALGEADRLYADDAKRTKVIREALARIREEVSK